MMRARNDNLPRAYRDDPAALWRQPETWFGFGMVAVLLVLPFALR
jgi:hypothetical protein